MMAADNLPSYMCPYADFDPLSDRCIKTKKKKTGGK